MDNLQKLGQKLKQGEFSNIIVCAGAGLSTSAGIPDFRSPGSGLYAKMKNFELPNPEMIFDIEYFRCDPQPFIALSRDIWPGRYRPTPGHCFLKLLDDHGILRRVYTQNIDGLELLTGMSCDKVVRCHGSFDSASCIDCHRESSTSAFLAASKSKELKPTRCAHCGGLVKPDIVFFGEPLPPAFDEHLNSDMASCDLLLVMGTSLAVHPFASLPNRVGTGVPRVLLNRRVVGSFRPSRGATAEAASAWPRDVVSQYSVDASVARICDAADWRAELDAAAACCGAARRPPLPVDVAPLSALGLSPLELVVSATGFVIILPGGRAGVSASVGWLLDWIPQVARAARSGCDPVHGRQRVHVVHVTGGGGGGGGGEGPRSHDGVGRLPSKLNCEGPCQGARPSALRAVLGRCVGGCGCGETTKAQFAGPAHVAEHALRLGGVGGGWLEEALDGLCAALERPLSGGRWAVLVLPCAVAAPTDAAGGADRMAREAESAAARAAAERLVAWYPTVAAATVSRNRGGGGSSCNSSDSPWFCGHIAAEELAVLAAEAAAEAAVG